MKRALQILVLSAALAACGAARPTGSGSTHPDRITREQIEVSTYTNLYDLVQALRPQWLRARGVQSVHLAGGVRVYLDNTRIGGPEELRRIAASGVHGLRYFDGQTASQRWGLDHDGGVIQVLTQPPGS